MVLHKISDSSPRIKEFLKVSSLELIYFCFLGSVFLLFIILPICFGKNFIYCLGIYLLSQNLYFSQVKKQNLEKLKLKAVLALNTGVSPQFTEATVKTLMSQTTDLYTDIYFYCSSSSSFQN